MASAMEPPEPHSVRLSYRSRIEQGGLSFDAGQEQVALALDSLLDVLVARNAANKGSALGWLFARRREAREKVTGLYIHGGVGRGKTMLMDMFHERVGGMTKRRAHFNAFMADVHDRIGRHRADLKAGLAKGDDPIPPVARALAAEARLLCFDEFSVTDIADAMILSRLFTALFAEGVVLVATSNVAPDDLYKDGLNRGLFLPFLSVLRRHCRVIAMDEGRDFRRDRLSALPTWIAPLGPAADRLMDEAWVAATAGAVAAAEDIAVKGRHVRVPRAAGRAARFTFAELCEMPLAARDYLAIAERYDTLFLDAVPVLDASRRNAAKRFILLVDTLYDRRIGLRASAAAGPDAIFAITTGSEAFEAARTVSRLVEMQDPAWAGAVETVRTG